MVYIIIYLVVNIDDGHFSIWSLDLFIHFSIPAVLNRRSSSVRWASISPSCTALRMFWIIGANAPSLPNNGFPAKALLDNLFSHLQMSSTTSSFVFMFIKTILLCFKCMTQFNLQSRNRRNTNIKFILYTSSSDHLHDRNHNIYHISTDAHLFFSRQKLRLLKFHILPD